MIGIVKMINHFHRIDRINKIYIKIQKISTPQTIFQINIVLTNVKILIHLRNISF